MTQAPRLAVFVVPSPRLGGWTAAISERAREMGWAVAPGGPEDNAAAGENGALLITRDLAELHAFSASHCVVLFDEPDACLGPVSAAPGQGIRANEVRSDVSVPWAVASGLAEIGATIVDARKPSIQLPGLGALAGGALPSLDSPGAERGVLAVFDRLPVPIGATATWGPDQFDYPFKREYFGGGPDIDLTGRPRGLVYGPFVQLPPGTWQAEIDISVDPERGRVPLRFDWGAGQDFVSVFNSVTVPGQYSLALVNRWDAAAAVQMRIWLTEGIFRGRFSFIGCRVTRVADDTSLTAHQGE